MLLNNIIHFINHIIQFINMLSNFIWIILMQTVKVLYYINFSKTFANVDWFNFYFYFPTENGATDSLSSVLSYPHRGQNGSCSGLHRKRNFETLWSRGRDTSFVRELKAEIWKIVVSACAQYAYGLSLQRVKWLRSTPRTAHHCTSSSKSFCLSSDSAMSSSCNFGCEKIKHNIIFYNTKFKW